jgi:hypothetical protein
VNETFGRYRLTERLGQGGMAEVFKVLLAFLSAHGRRYSAHDLAEFLTRFRGKGDGGASGSSETGP